MITHISRIVSNGGGEASPFLYVWIYVRARLWDKTARAR